MYEFRALRSTLLTSLTTKRARMIVKKIASSKTWKTWIEIDNLLILDLFFWLWIDVKREAKIEDLIDQEFDLYLYHQVERNDQFNKNWLRTMCYELIQQIIRQNSSYWVLYVSLRLNRHTRLIAYFYYVKYAKSKNSTYFRHLDMNIRQYLEFDHDANIIQDFVSMNDETKVDCTEILLDFHQHIKKWWQKMKRRDQVNDESVIDLEKLWKSKNIEIYDEFVFVSCSRDDARITRSKISHDSIKNVVRDIRRIILSWFVCVRENDETLNNIEFDLWSKLTIAHVQQNYIARTSFELHNRFDEISYKFSSETQLYLSSSLNQVLICRTSWDDSIAQMNANLILDENWQTTKSEMSKHRVKTLQRFKIAWVLIKKIEQLFYEKNNFFTNVDKQCDFWDDQITF